MRKKKKKNRISSETGTVVLFICRLLIPPVSILHLYLDSILSQEHERLLDFNEDMLWKEPGS